MNTNLNNIDTGFLKIEINTSTGTPINNASIYISYTGGPNTIIENLNTNSAGQTEILSLSTPPLEYSLNSNNILEPYAEYSVLIRADGFEDKLIAGVELFSGELAILPVTLFMGLIGLLVTAATGNSDPVVVFSTTMDSKFLTIVTLLFIAFAQVTTNVLNNIVPPSYVLMEQFKVKWSHATVIVGVLSVCCMPWKLVTEESAAGLNLFTQLYSAFLGPIFAVMAVDYFILRKQTLNVDDLYDKENGPFKGVNWAAIIAIIVGAICSLILMSYSWYVSLLPTGLTYYFMMKSSKTSFTKGTIFEK